MYHTITQLWYFITGSLGIGNGQTTLVMSSAIDLTPPGDGKGRYTKGANHTWLIQPTYTIGPITFVFSSLELYGNDVITLYDGSNTNNVLYRRVGGGGGNTPTSWIISSLSTATVVFSSSINTVTPSGVVSGNFKLSYYADGPNYHCGFPTNPGTDCHPSPLFPAIHLINFLSTTLCLLLYRSTM